MQTLDFFLQMYTATTILIISLVVVFMLLRISKMYSTIEELRMFVWSLLPCEPRDILERDYWRQGGEIKN